MKSAAPTPTTTPRGTPCSPRWDHYWIAWVESLEDSLKRRVCGAEVPGGSPCSLEPTSGNGRCPMHGGVPLIGGQDGNVNALRHGLHARRLRPCGPSCANWHTCPMASKEIAALAPSARPACVYEVTAYESTLHPVLRALGVDPQTPNAAEREENAGAALTRRLAIESAEAYSLSKVMAQRAANVMAHEDVCEKTEAFSGELLNRSSKLSGAGDAFIRFQREQRHWHKRLSESAEAFVKASPDATSIPAPAVPEMWVIKAPPVTPPPVPPNAGVRLDRLLKPLELPFRKTPTETPGVAAAMKHEQPKTIETSGPIADDDETVASEVDSEETEATMDDKETNSVQKPPMEPVNAPVGVTAPPRPKQRAIPSWEMEKLRRRQKQHRK